MRLPQEKVDKIVELLRGGNRRRVAAHMVGISEYRFKEWIAHNETFRKAVELAEAQAEADLVEVLFSNATKNRSFQSAITMLERRHADAWGRVERLEVQQQILQIKRLEEDLDSEGIPHPPLPQMIADFEALQKDTRKRNRVLKALPSG